MNRTATPRTVPSSGRSAPRPLRVEGLLLLDPAGDRPLTIDSVRFADDGIGVVRAAGQQPRVLPWTSVVAHAVEPWRGGSIPERWRDPTPGRTGQASPVGPVGYGVLISITTATGTFRFLQPGGDPGQLSGRIAAFADRYRGPAAIPTVTTPDEPQPPQQARGHRRPRWPRIQPYLVVALGVVVLVAITLILLQSAGLVHLPLLGGGGSGSLGRVRPFPGRG